MAHKAESYKVDDKKETIILYTNIEPNAAEQRMIDRFVDKGFEVKFAEKKPTLTVEQMREALAGDEATLKAFNDAYATKGKGKESGLFVACKIFNEWKKEQKKKDKKK